MNSFLLNLVLLSLSITFSSVFANTDFTNKNEEALQVSKLEIERANSFWRYLINTRKGNEFEPYLPLIGGTLNGPLQISANSDGSTQSRFTVYGAGSSYFDVWKDANQTPNLTLQRSDGAEVFKVMGHSMAATFNGHLTGSTATFGGSVQIGNTVNLNGGAGSYREISFRTNSALRWDLYTDPSAETGNSAGSNLSLASYTDEGAYHRNIFTANRSTGDIKFGNSLSIEGLLTGTSGTFSGTGEFGGYVRSGDFGSGYTISLATGTTAKGVNIGYSGDNDAGFIGAVHNGTSWKNLLMQPIGGNVGIGTTTPLEKLVVKEAIGNDAIALYDGPGTKRLSIGQESSYTGNYIDSKNIDFKIKTGYAGGSGGNIIFMTHDNGIANHHEQMRIDKVGNVGIGTINPQGYKLAVAGNVIAESVKVALQDTWPDYVFKSGNKLLPLSEVETYVKDNNHLPEMPSEEEVKKEGIDLGQMDAKLLKKIEELTLYMIDFKKEMELIKKENQNLKNEVGHLKANEKNKCFFH